jgi:hypothetical protein
MRRRLVAIGIVGVLCAAASIAAFVVAVTLLDTSGALSMSNDMTTPSADVNRRFALAQAGYTILRLVAPLAGGFLAAGIAILAMLARRWRAGNTIRPAPAR